MRIDANSDANAEIHGDTSRTFDRSASQSIKPRRDEQRQSGYSRRGFRIMCRKAGQWNLPNHPWGLRSRAVMIRSGAGRGI